MYTVELCRHYGKLKNFLHPQVSVYSHEIYIHTSIISTKKTNIFIVKLLIFRFIYRMGLVACTRTKNVVYHLVGRNHLTKNIYFRDTIEKQLHYVFNTTHKYQFWVMHFQKSCTKLDIWKPSNIIISTHFLARSIYFIIFKTDNIWIIHFFCYHQINDLGNQQLPKQQLLCFSGNQNIQQWRFFELYNHLLKWQSKYLSFLFNHG